MHPTALLILLFSPLTTALHQQPPLLFPLSLLPFSPTAPHDHARSLHGASIEDLTAKYPAYTFTQRITHFAAEPPPGFNRTFQQRYWIDARYYKPAGPVIVIEGGEDDATGRLPTLDSGLGHYLARELGGVVLLLEHRYYGESVVSADLTTPSLHLLTTAESLADTAYFSSHFPYTAHPELPFFIGSNSTPWIHYGGSYGGAKSAFLRHLYPDQIWGSIASSAVVWATDDFWQYFEPMRQHGEAKCIQTIENVVATLDRAIAVAGTDAADGEYVKSATVRRLMAMFGLEGLESVRDWMMVLSHPLSWWQAQNWDTSLPGTYEWARFCAALTAGLGDVVDDATGTKAPPVQVPLAEENNGHAAAANRPDIAATANAIANYARYVKTVYADACTAHGRAVERCFGTRHLPAYTDTSLAATARLWAWQVCLEWGYRLHPAPASRPSLISRTLGGDYKRQICHRAFGFAPAHRADVARINRWGNFSLAAARLLYVDGDQDPWLWATVHSPLAAEHGRKGGEGDDDDDDGILLKRAWHHVDENGLGVIRQEPKRIREVHRREIDTVRGWVEEWRERRRDG